GFPRARGREAGTSISGLIIRVSSPCARARGSLRAKLQTAVSAPRVRAGASLVRLLNLRSCHGSPRARGRSDGGRIQIAIEPRLPACARRVRVRYARPQPKTLNPSNIFLPSPAVWRARGLGPLPLGVGARRGPGPGPTLAVEVRPGRDPRRD